MNNETNTSPANSLLCARQISKAYGALQANDQISLNIEKGSIHALIGENGAGKSTLVSIICGSTQADNGSIQWQGQSVKIANPAAARELGIGVVFQHFALVDQLTVEDNITLSVRNMSSVEIKKQLQYIAKRYRLEVSLSRYVGDLSAGEKQRIEILRCLIQSPQLLILDEPTSVLTPGEVKDLFVLLKQLATEGKSILFISHKINEVCELCDKALVLRQGRMVADDINPQQAGRQQLIRLMLGEEPDSVSVEEQSPENAAKPPILEIQRLSSPTPTGKLWVEYLALRPGAIIGIAGIAGNGQDDLLNCLSGEILTDKNMITIHKKSIGHWNSARRRLSGILTTPTERHGRATVGDMSLIDNGLLGIAQPRQYTHRGFIRFRAVRAVAADVIKTFAVRAESPETRASALSGGNLQKFIIGRALMQQPNVFITANPTWGVDVKSAAFIHESICELRRRGSAILILSEDLDELLTLCDEIAVINNGHLSSPIKRQNLSIDEIGAHMASSIPSPNNESSAL